MSLRSKIFLILVTVVVCYAAVENGSARLFVGKVFGRLELQEAEEDLARVHARLDAELEDLSGKARVYAGTSALSEFITSGDPAFIEHDLGRDAMQRAGVDLFYICAAGGKVLWGSVLDPETGEPIRLGDFPRESLAPNHPALTFRLEEERVSGMLMTRLHPMLLSTLPVPDRAGGLLTDEEPFRHPVHGAVILGRFLGPTLERRIVQEELELISQEGVAAPKTIELLDPRAPGVPEDLGPEKNRIFREGEDGLLHAYDSGRVKALRTDDPLVLHVALDRVMAAHQKDSVNYSMLTTLIGGLLILFVLLRLLQRIVIAPLTQLTEKAVEIGKRDDTTIRVALERSDEIGQLAGEFDRMLGKLARSREQVIQTARKAGMSEIATGVLHNVGNVLNSVNVSANLATRKTEELAVRDLELLAEVLHAHEADLAGFVAGDPRGKHVVPLLTELAGALGTQRKSIQEELRALNQGIEHIAELVRAQQSYAGTKGVFELAALSEQVDAALTICAQSLGAEQGIEVVREFESMPAVRTDNHKLMEILVNLIHNAVQALAERGGTEKRLTLRVSRPDARTARIEVRDNGIGIPRGNLTKIFQHGFTTKKNGHGFGLHVSANAATEMGAKLSARSDGPGQGASFTLDMPAEESVATAAA